jgi:hypothetical protein
MKRILDLLFLIVPPLFFVTLYFGLQIIFSLATERNNFKISKKIIKTKKYTKVKEKKNLVEMEDFPIYNLNFLRENYAKEDKKNDSLNLLNELALELHLRPHVKNTTTVGRVPRID